MPAPSSSRRTPDHPDRDAEEARWRVLMVQALEGDAGAYRKLLEELYEVVTAYVRRMIGDGAGVEDCVQECLEALHRHRHTYDARRAFRPWFFTLVRHKAIDVLRRDGIRREHASDRFAEAEDTVPARPQPVDAVLDSESWLARLEPDHRDAVVWTKLWGLSTAEAAERAGTSAVAMRTRVHRALRRLQRILEDES